MLLAILERYDESLQLLEYSLATFNESTESQDHASQSLITLLVKTAAIHEKNHEWVLLIQLYVCLISCIADMSLPRRTCAALLR